ncbi:SEC-C domain-containing protein [Nocardiopsis aegyptia]|uniref:Tetratricopeptide (TPR) repeat protein n=1 Tax=Nocardiopsis aegyptia TaxID=220378 RepID=A0A7Z0EJ61_9ACTN|nr:SEC-C domain-containing protein [Nocardiopsis aegyptia]NYJ33053.1 tetratricopeptide (TPR) repeat protein [Nocardiopsis aegyptia]
MASVHPSEATPAAGSSAPQNPAGLHPRLWETVQELNLPEEILDDLSEHPDVAGDILLDTVEHLEHIERPDVARRLLESLRAHPPTKEAGQYASYTLVLRLREDGETNEAETMIEEFLRPGHLDPGPALLVAEDFEESGRLDEALHCYNIASRDDLARPAAGLVGAGHFVLMPLLGRARVRQRLGMAEDEHDRAALSAAKDLPAAEDVVDFEEDWDEFSHLDGGLPGWDDEIAAPPAEVRGLRVVYSRGSLARARALGLIDPEAADDDHYREAERELREAVRQRPGTLFAVVTADAEEVASYAVEQALDPADELTPGEWAEATLPDDSPRLLPWPPERNKPCWCGSTRKYKKCCGSPSLR